MKRTINPIEGTLFGRFSPQLKAWWAYREHVVDVAKSADSLTTEEAAAFAEIAYVVAENGKIVSQPRFIPIPAMIRLTTRLAAKLNPMLEIRFDSSSWEQFKLAIKTRNRITHPKTENDLAISDRDLDVCQSGFGWLFDLCLTAMQAANEALKDYVVSAQSLIALLKRGDPQTLAEYHEAAKEIER